VGAGEGVTRCVATSEMCSGRLVSSALWIIDRRRPGTVGVHGMERDDERDVIRQRPSASATPMKQPVPTNATRRLMRDASRSREFEPRILGHEHIDLRSAIHPIRPLLDCSRPGRRPSKARERLNKLVRYAPGPITVNNLRLTRLHGAL